MLNKVTLHSVPFASMIAIMSGEENLNAQLVHGTLAAMHCLPVAGRRTHGGCWGLQYSCRAQEIWALIMIVIVILMVTMIVMIIVTTFILLLTKAYPRRGSWSPRCPRFDVSEKQGFFSFKFGQTLNPKPKP